MVFIFNGKPEPARTWAWARTNLPRDSAARESEQVLEQEKTTHLCQPKALCKHYLSQTQTLVLMSSWRPYVERLHLSVEGMLVFSSNPSVYLWESSLSCAQTVISDIASGLAIWEVGSPLGPSIYLALSAFTFNRSKISGLYKIFFKLTDLSFVQTTIICL